MIRVKGGADMKIGHRMIAFGLIATGMVAAACANSAPPAGTKTAAQIVPAMKAAMRAATSVRVAGTVTNGSTTVVIDESISGRDASGRFHADGIIAAIINVDGKVYLQVNADVLKLRGRPAADCRTVCGKYLQVPASQFASFTVSASMSHWTSAIASSMPSAAGDSADLFKPATFEGHRVLQLRQATQTVDVARTGPPYPLYLSSPTYGSVTLSEWNSVPPVTPPPPSQVVTLSSL